MNRTVALARVLGWMICLAMGSAVRSAEDVPDGPRSVDAGAQPTPWQSLFDGETLSGWAVTPFGGSQVPEVRDGELVLPIGVLMSGVHYTNPVPRINFEVELEARRLAGSDFFCALTVPVAETNCTLIVGGWGGGLVGISSLDGCDASENETTRIMRFEKERWYRIRMRVQPQRLTAWIDDKPVVDVSIEDRQVSLRPGDIELSVPLGIATYETAAGFRNIRIRDLPPESTPGR